MARTTTGICLVTGHRADCWGPLAPCLPGWGGSLPRWLCSPSTQSPGHRLAEPAISLAISCDGDSYEREAPTPAIRSGPRPQDGGGTV